MSTIVVGIFAVLYYRQIGGLKAEERYKTLVRANEEQADRLISSFEARLRLKQIEVEALQREIEVLRASVVELRRQRELIG